MTSRERMLRALRHQEADRIPQQDSLWATTAERWRNEGMPDVSQTEYFAWDMYGFSADDSLQLPFEVLEETEEFLISRGGDGATVKNWKGSVTTPELVDFAFTSSDEWGKVKPRMVWNDTRINWSWLQQVNDEAERLQSFRYLGMYEGFTRICDMCGTDTILMAMLEEPEWVADMLLTRAQLEIDIAGAMLEGGYQFEAGWIYDDLGFKLRSFFSVDTYRQIVMPAHKMICDFFKNRGMMMILHSCGYIMELLPLIIETGFDCLQPMEVKAGNDLLQIKAQYGDKIALMGGIDVRAMADPDPAVIEQEISSKIPLAKLGGGYIYHSDHSIPDNVSFSQYQRVMELVRQYGG